MGNGPVPDHAFCTHPEGSVPVEDPSHCLSDHKGREEQDFQPGDGPQAFFEAVWTVMMPKSEHPQNGLIECEPVSLQFVRTKTAVISETQGPHQLADGRLLFFHSGSSLK
jgi:hypothetical protein